MVSVNFWGKGSLTVKYWYRNTLRSSVQKRLNRSRCRLGCGLGWVQGIVSYTGVQIPRGKEEFWGKGAPTVK